MTHHDLLHLPNATRGELLPKDNQLIRRTRSRQLADLCLREARANDETDLTMTKIEGWTLAGGVGLSSVAQVGRVQEHLELLQPGISARVNYLAEVHAHGVADELQVLRHRLRRI